MVNNAALGFTIQKMICDKYHITPNSIKATNNFISAYDGNLSKSLESIIEDVFMCIHLNPLECTTFMDKSTGIGEVPYNFVLEDNSTMSIRTNITGKMVAPREVGQAGFPKLNKYFGSIYGKEISNQEDIKNLIFYKIDKVLPIFFDHLFDADYIVWIYNDKKNNKLISKIIKGEQDVNIEYVREFFSFTRNIEKWTESTTLKYKGISIAEIQVHKNRTFKFRFKMSAILDFMYEKQITNETLGVTCEKVICDMFNLDYPSSFYKRYSQDAQYQLQDVIKEVFLHLPNPIQYAGNLVGDRGGFSKSSIDFILKGDKSLSVKTNIGKKVCPSEVGQPNDKTCYLYFKDYIDGKEVNKISFKNMVYNHIDKIMPIYLAHLFDCDYLLRIFANSKNDFIKSGYAYGYNIVKKDFGIHMNWDINKFSFSQPTIDTWKESNTVYYDGVTLGEFQVHNNRNCFKFRFNFDNLLKTINNE